MHTEEIIETACLSITETIDLAPVIKRTAGQLRMTSLDSTQRLKLDALWELTFSTYQDVLRERCNVAALQARGLVGLAEYVELEVTQESLRFPQPAELHTAMCTSSLAAGGGGYALLGYVRLHARHTDLQCAPSECGRMRILSRLVQPCASLGQRAVRTLPAEMAELARATRAESPCMQALGVRPAHLDPVVPASLEQAIVFAEHDADAHRFVYAGAYMSIAQAWAHAHAAAAGMPVLGGMRLRASFKRAFAAGQACVVRTQLFADGAAVEAIVNFHSVVDGKIDPRPDVLVRIESRALARKSTPNCGSQASSALSNLTATENAGARAKRAAAV